jgi:PTS system nitrogen regulatory IIA component
MNNTAILTTQELASYMKLNEKTILKMAQNKDLPGIKVGNQWRFHLEAIDRHLQKDLMQTPESELDLILETTTPDIPLSRLFDESIINLEMKARAKTEALKELSHDAFAADLVEDADKLYSELDRREQMLSTAAGNGIAVPHPRNPDPALFRRANILMARSDAGIDFDAPDKQKVHLFFMTCAPNIVIHLRLLAKLSKMLHIKGAINKFMNLSSGREIIQFLLEVERQNLFSWASVEKEDTND